MAFGESIFGDLIDFVVVVVVVVVVGDFASFGELMIDRGDLAPVDVGECIVAVA